MYLWRWLFQFMVHRYHPVTNSKNQPKMGIKKRWAISGSLLRNQLSLMFPKKHFSLLCFPEKTLWCRIIRIRISIWVNKDLETPLHLCIIQLKSLRRVKD